METNNSEYTYVKRTIQNYSTNQLAWLVKALTASRWLNTPIQEDIRTAAIEILYKRAQYN